MNKEYSQQTYLKTEPQTFKKLKLGTQTVGSTHKLI